MNQKAISSLVWSIADLLRGDFIQSEYGGIILPFTILRRLDCVMAPTREAVLRVHEEKLAEGYEETGSFLMEESGLTFYNTSNLSLETLMGDQDNIAANLEAFVQGFSPDVRDIFERFKFSTLIDQLGRKNLLYRMTEKFASIDLSPENVTNYQMGLLFEELIQRFAELSNATAGEHFTPREVIHLMVGLLFIEDDEILSNSGVVRSIYDPTAGTGGMLSIADEYLREHNRGATLVMYGQELNDESFAVCKADMLIKGQDITHIVSGNTLSKDGHAGARFDYMLSNPPFGVEWKKVEKEVRDEHRKGADGRFAPGLPRVSDGSLLFLLHLVSKMREAKDGGSRIGIVLNGSPLFTGGAGSGESEIRRHLLENDLVEAIVALPTDMFYNTGIATYVWILSNRKQSERQGKVQLIDGSALWRKMRKSLGSKRREMTDEDIATITRVFGGFTEANIAFSFDKDGKEVLRRSILPGEVAPSGLDGGKVRVAPLSIVLPVQAFGYRTITVERPKRDEAGEVVVATKGKAKGQQVADPDLRDTENVPLAEDVDAYFQREVVPHVEDAWIDHDKTKIGYEIPFGRHFYVFEQPRSLEAIDSDLKHVTGRIMKMIEGLAA